MKAMWERTLSALGRTMQASFGAALSASILLFLTDGGEPTLSNAFELLYFVLPIAFLVAFPHALLFGLPYAWLMRRLQSESVWTMAVGGLLIGGLPIGFLENAPMLGAICAASGAAGAVTLHRLDRKNGRHLVPA